MKERWSRLGWHGMVQIQHGDTHSHTYTHTKNTTKHKQENSSRFAQKGYYSDVRLYSSGSSPLTGLSGQSKASTSPSPHMTDVNVFLKAQRTRGIFLIWVIHVGKMFYPICQIMKLTFIQMHVFRNKHGRVQQRKPDHSVPTVIPAAQPTVVKRVTQQTNESQLQGCEVTLRANILLAC